MKNIPKISIIILNWNGGDIVDKCVNSLINKTIYPKDNLDIVLVDNASSDGSLKNLKEKYGNMLYIIPLKRNLGFIRGNNIGMKYALKRFNCDYILLLNNDIEIIEIDWLKKLVSLAETDRYIGIIGPKLIFPNGRIQWCGRKREKKAFFLIAQTLTARFNPGFGMPEELATCSNFIGEVNTISGACMLIKTELINKLGLLDLRLAPMYQEDVEYSYRAWKNGYKVIYRGDVKLIHHEGYSSENNKFTHNDIQLCKYYWATRNSLIVCFSYFGKIKTFVFGLPIYILIAIFEKKDKTCKVNFLNIKVKKDIDKSLGLLAISIKKALERYE